MEDVKKTYAWQEAMELSRELIRLCEEFSDGDRNVLVGHLRQAVVDIPATVAADIKVGRSATMEPAIRLATELELVHRVYPAIETGSVPQKLEALIQRMESVNFVEREPEPIEESAIEESETEAEAPAEVAEPVTITPKIES